VRPNREQDRRTEVRLHPPAYTGPRYQMYLTSGLIHELRCEPTASTNIGPIGCTRSHIHFSRERGFDRVTDESRIIQRMTYHEPLWNQRRLDYRRCLSTVFPSRVLLGLTIHLAQVVSLLYRSMPRPKPHCQPLHPRVHVFSNVNRATFPTDCVSVEYLPGLVGSDQEEEQVRREKILTQDQT